MSALVADAELRWSVLKNTLAQVVGRNLISLSRLAVAALIVRAFGKTTFGEYSLIFGILSIGEWMLDFGTTETFVREICRDPDRREHLLRIVSRAKLWQIPAACAAVAVALLALRYPMPVVEAGIVGAASLVFFGGVLVYRIVFKATLTMERELAAELLSVLAILPLVFWVGRKGLGLTALLGCHLVSRAIFFGLCARFGRGRFRISAASTTTSEARVALRTSAPIGIIGLLVAVYEAMDVLVLSKLGGVSDVAYYSAAQRLIWPMLIGLSSIGSTLYPIAASYWPLERDRFEQACQRGVDTVVVLAGFAICAVASGAEFFMGILGSDLVKGAPALRILASLCFVKAITSTVGPLLYVVDAQKQTLRFIMVAVVAKLATLMLLAPPFGYLGVAFGALGVEICFSIIPAVRLFRRFSGYRLSWSAASRTLVVIVAAGSIAHAVAGGSYFTAAVVGPALYTPLIFLSGAASVSELQSLVRLRWRTA
jgi:O-antigen/teichoic acid export membrane protein